MLGKLLFDSHPQTQRRGISFYTAACCLDPDLMPPHFPESQAEASCGGPSEPQCYRCPRCRIWSGEGGPSWFPEEANHKLSSCLTKQYMMTNNYEGSRHIHNQTIKFTFWQDNYLLSYGLMRAQWKEEVMWLCWMSVPVSQH